MTVTALASATIGVTGTIDLSFSGLASGNRYLRSIACDGAAGIAPPTIIRVDAP